MELIWYVYIAEIRDTAHAETKEVINVICIDKEYTCGRY